MMRGGVVVERDSCQAVLYSGRDCKRYALIGSRWCLSHVPVNHFRDIDMTRADRARARSWWHRALRALA